MIEAGWESCRTGWSSALNNVARKCDVQIGTENEGLPSTVTETLTDVQCVTMTDEGLGVLVVTTAYRFIPYGDIVGLSAPRPIPQPAS